MDSSSEAAADPAGGGAGLGAPDLAALAGLLADRTRAAFALALLDGRAWTVTELAHHAGVAVSTATGHLNLLVRGGLLGEVRQGRHRYVRLAGPRVAELVEALAALAPPTAPPRALSAASRGRALARGRTCYDHLAGTLGVRLTDAMTGRGLLDWDGEDPRLTGAGRGWLQGLGIEAPTGVGRRPAVRACLDWTERRPHLAGRVGAALCARALADAWVTRIGSGRAVSVTAKGRAILNDRLGLVLD